MNIAKKYFEEQLKNPEFNKVYLIEKRKLDIKYKLEKLKKAIEKQEPVEKITTEVNIIKDMVLESLVLV